MRLTPEQIERFDRDGYLFFPALFRPDEIEGPDRRSPGALRAAPPRERAREERRRRCAPISPRTCTASPSPGSRAIRAWSSRSCSCSAKPVYMHQFKINGKMAFDGDVWQWHQDYGTWKNDDQMPEPRAMNVAIFLDEVNEFNGPLMFIPGSHKLGVLDAAHDTSTTSYPLWTIDHDDHRQAGGARRHRRAEGAGRLDDPVPLLPGARVDVEPVAVEPRQRVPEPVRGVQPHPPLQAAGIHRAPRLHADRMPARRLPAAATTTVPLPWKDGTPAASALEHADQLCRHGRAGDAFSAIMNLSRQAAQRAAQGKPLRVGLIGAGKFGAMYLAQVPQARRACTWSASPTCRPRMRARISSAWAGSRERYAAPSLDDALATGATHVGDDWQALVAHPQHRHRRRMHRQSDRRGRALPRRVPPTASTSSTSRSRPTRSAARCSRARRPRRAWSTASPTATSRR